MNRLPDNFIVIPKQDILVRDDKMILGMENSMIKAGYLEENDQLVFNHNIGYIVQHPTRIELPKIGESSGVTGHNPLFPNYENRAFTQPPKEELKYYNEKDGYVPRGKRQQLEYIDKKLLINKGKILNLAAHDPQNWRTVIEIWAQTVTQEFDKLSITMSALEMYAFLENFLGESTRAMWESFKLHHPQEYIKAIEMGPNI